MGIFFWGGGWGGLWGKGELKAKLKNQCMHGDRNVNFLHPVDPIIDENLKTLCFCICPLMCRVDIPLVSFYTNFDTYLQKK